jgi:MFS family permease
MTQHERNVLVITCLGHFLSHFNMLVFPAVVLPLTSRLDLPLAQVLGLSFWMYLLFGVTALPWGLIADRLGGRMLMQLFFAGSGVFGLAAAGWMDSPLLLSVSLAGVGFFSGIYHPVGLGLISKQVTRISVGMGINGMFGNLGLAAAPLIAGILTWVWGPWAAYLALGGLNLAGLLVMSLMPLLATESAALETKDNGPGRGVIVLLVAMMLGGVVYRGATVILPAFFELRNQAVFEWFSYHLPAGLSANLVATLFTSIIFLVAMFGQYLGGRVAEHRSLPHCYLVFHLVTIPAAFFMAWTTDLSLVLLALIYFFFLLGMQPIENTLLSRLIPARWHHSAFGMKFVFTFGVGALAVHGVRIIEKGFGIKWVFPALSGVSVLLVISILFLIIRTRPSPEAMTPVTGSPAPAAES